MPKDDEDSEFIEDEIDELDEGDIGSDTEVVVPVKGGAAEEDEEIEEVLQDEEKKIDPRSIKINKIVAPDKRVTSERMTGLEFARLVGDRAAHLDKGAPPYIDTTKFTNTIAIAYTEVKMRLVPFAILRKVGENTYEKWKVKEMTLGDIPTLEDFVK